jgi:molybdopterin-guanine dinucleotide biosynthesis protein A
VIAGAVLAGGESRRFGRNKALQTLKDMRLIDRAVAHLAAFCDPVMVVANDLLPYVDLDALLVRDVIPRFGPLGGIYTALYFSPHPWVFVRATDMPFLEPSLAQALIALTQNPRLDVIVLKKDQAFEPLMALYHVRCLPHIRRCMEADRRQVISFYRHVHVHAVEEPQWRAYDPEGVSLWNINTLEDWHRIVRWCDEPGHTGAPSPEDA